MVSLAKIEEDAKLIPSYIKKWQEILRLQGWEIRYELVDNLPDGKAAEVYYNSIKRLAVLRYMTPECVEIEASREDMLFPEVLSSYEEKTIHELLHLLFADFSELFWQAAPLYGEEARKIWEEQSAYTEERAVENLTKVLLELDRGGGKCG